VLTPSPSTRTLPHDAASEGIVLAAVLSGGTPVLDELDWLPADAFYVRSNRLIVDAAREVRDAAAPVEAESIIARLRDTGRLEEVGGIHRVMEIATGFLTVANCDFYARRIADKAALRRAIELGHRAIADAYDRQDDADAVLAAIEDAATRLRESSAATDRNDLAAGCDAVTAAIALREDGKHGKLGLATGVQAWDDAFYGILPGRLYLLAARPRLGKTALAEAIATNVAQVGEPVLFVSLEMTEERLVGRMAARMAGADYSKWLRGYPTREESARMAVAVDEIRKLPLHVWAPPSATAQQVRGLVRRAARRGVKLFVLDYFSRLDIGGGGDGAKRHEAFAAASCTITRAVKESGMAGIVICQLGRESEKEQLRLGHLAETRQLEQDADAVLFLDCDNMKADPRTVVFAAEKNRDGPEGVSRMLFDGPTMAFKPMEKGA
jgi:replicative DNA helicase